MKEVTVKAWDDLHFHHRGERVEAEHGPPVRLRLDDEDVELDLTAEHKAELAKMLADWLKAGTPVAKATHGRRSQPASVPAGAPAGKSALARSRRYNREMAAWGRRQVLPDGSPAYEGLRAGEEARDPGGVKIKPYYPQALRDDYAAYLARNTGSPGM